MPSCSKLNLLVLETYTLTSKGVLTKPDRLAEGFPANALRSILSGKTFALGKHGYYVTMQPSKVKIDQGITHAAARSDEMLWFASKEPWKQQLAEFKDRFGTRKLQIDLSRKLRAQIAAS